MEAQTFGSHPYQVKLANQADARKDRFRIGSKPVFACRQDPWILFKLKVCQRFLRTALKAGLVDDWGVQHRDVQEEPRLFRIRNAETILLEHLAPGVHPGA